MEGLFFGVSLLALVVIIHWSIINDKKGLTDKTIGLLAMNDRGLPSEIKGGEQAKMQRPPRRQRR